jgi:hypothetical protein
MQVIRPKDNRTGRPDMKKVIVAGRDTREDS